MNFDNFTIKAQEAVQRAVERAQSGGQQAVSAAHLLAGVMAVGENVTQFLFGKTGVNAQQLQTVVDSHLRSLPRVQGGEPYLDSEANAVLARAIDTARKEGDTFVGLEPLLMALLDVKSTASAMLKDAGMTADGLRKAVGELFNARRIKPM